MKIIYDPKQKMYSVQIEGQETTTLINTSDIVEARESFVEQMAWLFNTTVNKALKDYD